MRRVGVVVLAGIIAAAGCTSDAAPDLGSSASATQAMERAAVALGGIDRLRALKSLIMEGGGTQRNLGQDLTPDATGQTFAISEYRRILSFSADAGRTELTRTPAFPYFQGPAARTQIMGVDGSVGYNVSPLGVSVRVSDAATRQRRDEMLHHPIAIVRTALEPGTTLSNVRTEGAETLIDVGTPAGATFTVGLDGSTSLPLRVRSPSEDPNLGDVVLETAFDDYRDADGIKVPFRVVTKTDRWTTSELVFTTVDVDGISGDMAAPADATASRPAAAVPTPVVDDQEIAPGVWLMAGQSHHSVLVELQDELLLVEAPQSEARTRAVITRARELRPDKPLTRLVNTHHHFDHSAGFRAAVAERLTVVTHEGNAEFVREMVRRPHSRTPDILARQPQPLTLVSVGDRLELGDMSREVQALHVARSPHSATMLMVYLPRERLLVEADAFTPNAPAPFAAHLLDEIGRRRLAIDRIVPLHGSVVPFDALRTTVRQAVATQD